MPPLNHFFPRVLIILALVGLSLNEPLALASKGGAISAVTSVAVGTGKSDGNGGSGAAVKPVLEPKATPGGLLYKSSSKHTPNPKGYNPDAGIEPKNSFELFESSISTTKSPDIRFAKGKDGTVHIFRYEKYGSNTWHWAGSTNQGANSLRSHQIPIDVKRELDLPKKGW